MEQFFFSWFNRLDICFRSIITSIKIQKLSVFPVQINMIKPLPNIAQKSQMNKGNQGNLSAGGGGGGGGLKEKMRTWLP